MKVSEIIKVPEIEKVFPRPANYEEIKADIAGRGIQEPVVVNGKNQLICGYTRLAAAEESGIEGIPHRTVDVTDPAAMIEYAILDNIRRRQLTDLQVVQYGILLEEIYGNRQGQRSDLGTTCPEVGRGRTRDAVASKIQEQTGAKMSGRKYDRLKTIATKAAPEVKRKLNQGEISQGAALDLCRFEPATQTRLLESDIDTQAKIFADVFDKKARGNIEDSFIIQIFQLIPVAQSLLAALNPTARSGLHFRNCCMEIDLHGQVAMGGILNRRKLWVLLVGVPKHVLERYFIEATEAGEEVTSEGLLKFWDQAEGRRLSKRGMSDWIRLTEIPRSEDEADLGMPEVSREEAESQSDPMAGSVKCGR